MDRSRDQLGQYVTHKRNPMREGCCHFVILYMYIWCEQISVDNAQISGNCAPQLSCHYEKTLSFSL